MKKAPRRVLFVVIALLGEGHVLAVRAFEEIDSLTVWTHLGGVGRASNSWCLLVITG